MAVDGLLAQLYPNAMETERGGSGQTASSSVLAGIVPIADSIIIVERYIGTGVYIVGTASLEGGIITFNLDGVSTTYDRYSAPPYRCGVLMFGQGGLQNTTHYLTATLSGPSPANATERPFFEFQYLQFTQLDAGDTLTTSSVIPTSGTVSSTTASATSTQSGSNKVNAGAIGGGIAAGAIGLVIIGFVIWFCVRREKKEKAAVVETRPDLDPPRQSFIYSPVGASGYGRLSHDGLPSEGRRSMSAVPGSNSMSAVPGSNPTAAPWNPDAHLAATLAPHADSPATHYPPGAAAPSVIHSSSQSSGSSPVRTYSSGFPLSSTSSYTVQNPGPGHHAGMMGLSGLPESEVERIAARVASMMHHPPQPSQAPQPQPERPVKGGAPPPAPETFDDLPPPMYEPRQDP
ncbi:hypothetical protein FRC01_000038 [Tulasnella sp. 417]|nr:hypothetical protein FRC01_000038 [Tulasnella sp. 417]